MGIATQPTQLGAGGPFQLSSANTKVASLSNSLTSSMSQGFHHQGIFSFSDGFDGGRSASQDHHQQQHIAQQSRRDKLRVQVFDAAGLPLVPIDDDADDEPNMYDSAGATNVGASNMLSEMFNFPAPGPSATELLVNQISGGGGGYRLPQRQTSGLAGFAGDWYVASRQGMVLRGSSNLSSIGGSTSKHHHDDVGGAGGQQPPPQHPITGVSAQLFLMNLQAAPPPTQQDPRSPSSQASAAPLTLHHPQDFQAFGEPSFAAEAATGGVVEGQGLSLSLSSSLQPFDLAKAEEIRVREGVLYYNQQQHQQAQQQSLNSLQAHAAHSGQQLNMAVAGYGTMGVVNVLRNSKYARAAQELLEEFCSVGRGQMTGSKLGRQRGANSSNPNPNNGGGGGGGSSTSAAASTSVAKDVPPLSPADRFEYQRKKAKLISMIDEVDRRYNHYCDQMQMVVNSFDSVMGFGAATPYTALAEKAMSRHFRCLKDSITAQLKQTCELLGDKDGTSSSSLTKGETPRLKVIDQNLRQQRAFHQMGMMEQEAWRPQRGLPERSVSLLRAWLFEHFLHPYPNDADKHLLARQTGLSRNQVSNWFINARVRLWKPMVEEMYHQELKDAEGRDQSEGSDQRTRSPTQQQQQQPGQRPETDAPSENDTSPNSPTLGGRHHLQHRHVRHTSTSESVPPQPGPVTSHQPPGGGDSVLTGIDALAEHQQVGTSDDMYQFSALAGPQATGMRFGAAGDVSLTLGLRQTGGNASDKSRFSVRDFGGL